MGDKEDLEGIIAGVEGKQSLAFRLQRKIVKRRHLFEAGIGLAAGIATHLIMKSPAYGEVHQPIEIDLPFILGGGLGVVFSYISASAMEFCDTIGTTPGKLYKHFRELSKKNPWPASPNLLQRIADDLLKHPMYTSILTNFLIHAKAVAYTLRYDLLNQPIIGEGFIKKQSLLSGNNSKYFLMGIFSLSFVFSCLKIMLNYGMPRATVADVKEAHKTISGDSKGLIDYLEGQLSKSYHPLIARKLCKQYFKQGYVDRALLLQKEIIERGGSIRPRNRFSVYMLDLAEVGADIRTLKNHPSDATKYLQPAILIYGYNPKKSLKLWEKACSIPNENLSQIVTLYAYFLEKNNLKKEAQAQWEKAGKLVFADTSLEQEQLGEFAHRVFAVGPSKFLKDCFVFKEHSSVQQANQEKEFNVTLEHIINAAGMQHKLVAPESISIFQPASAKPVYSMKRLPGKSLFDKVQQNDSDKYGAFSKTIEALAFFHAKFPMEKVKTGQVALCHKTRGMIVYRDLIADKEVAKQFAREFIGNFRPVYNTLKNSILVPNKDAHPGNWLMSKDSRITYIDNEDKGLVPIQTDIINLMEYNTGFSKSQKLELINHYIDNYNEHLGFQAITDRKQFMLGYYNAIIQRSFSYISSLIKRTTQKQYATVWLNNALEAIDAIITEHPGYYRQYSTNYENLRRSFESLRKVIGV